MFITWELFVGPILLVVAAFFYFRETKQAEARLTKIVERVKRQNDSRVRRPGAARKPVQVGFLDRLSLTKEIQRDINVAGLRLSATSFLLAVAALGVFSSSFVDTQPIILLVALYVNAALATGLSFLPLALMISLFGWYRLGRMVIGIIGDRRLKKLRSQLPQAVDGIARAMRVGRSFEGAITSIADNLPEPIGVEFKAASKIISVGGAPDKALRSIAKELRLEEFNMLINTYSVHLETGGNLVEALETLSGSIRDRLQLKGKIEAMVAEGKFSAYVIGALPFVTLFYFQLTNPAYVAPLFSDLRGMGVLILCILMILSGLWILLRMARIKI